MFISSASKQRYTSDEYPLRVRGTPEYNPLYDAFPSDLSPPQRQTQSDFRPITPPPPPRFKQNFRDDIENAYDKPRSYHLNNKQKQCTNGQQQHSSHSRKNVGEK
jgi:hypothetical protein